VKITTSQEGLRTLALVRIASRTVDWWGLTLAGVVVAASVAAGALAAQHSTVALLLAFAAGTACLLTLGRRLSTLFYVLVACLLTGYAFLDKGFAYIGLYPVYVSEIVLFAAVLHLAVVFRRLRFTWLHWLLVAFMVLGLFRTVPYLERDGVNALRDGALWGYGIFALAISAALGTKQIERITVLYGRAIPLFVLWVPLALIAVGVFGPQLPGVLGSNVSVLTLRVDDLGVHLAGIGAFLILGLGRGRLNAWTETTLWVLWIVGVGIIGSGNRGGMLAAGMAFVAAILVPPAPRFVLRFGLAALIAVLVATAAPEIAVVRDRTASVTQIMQNLSSIVVDTGVSDLEATKGWRQAWWNTIIGYTVDGPYFWTGKGFGVNLADDDGFQGDVGDLTPLRSPHNSHLTVLARMGVPGLLLWVLLQASFGLSLVWAYFRARRNGAAFWCRIDAWLLAYWLAMIVAASFDVFFEGPQAGIWFWSVFGLGIGAIGIQRSLFDKPNEDPTLSAAQRREPKRSASPTP
jgi:hypothetical protein